MATAAAAGRSGACCRRTATTLSDCSSSSSNQRAGVILLYYETAGTHNDTNERAGGSEKDAMCVCVWWSVTGRVWQNAEHVPRLNLYPLIFSLTKTHSRGVCCARLLCRGLSPARVQRVRRRSSLAGGGRRSYETISRARSDIIIIYSIKSRTRCPIINCWKSDCSTSKLCIGLWDQPSKTRIVSRTRGRPALPLFPKK